MRPSDSYVLHHCSAIRRSIFSPVIKNFENIIVQISKNIKIYVLVSSTVHVN
jgi:hypothetical protein